jgi:hypothetical protein
VVTIGENAFMYCQEITSVTIPDSVTTIGKSAFFSCTSLSSIEIPDTVISIGEQAFRGCSKLSSIELPASLTTIGSSAFMSCSRLSSITIPASVISFGGNAFSDCGALETVEISEGVTTIGGSAFSSCKSLKSVTIPTSLTVIGSDTFRYCESLRTVDIPVSVTQIGSYAFCSCTSLSFINYGGTEEQWSKISFGSGWDSDTGTYTLVFAGGAGEPEAPGIPSDVRVDQTVTFGSYEQDNESANGEEAIEWIVLDVQDGRALLLSKYALDARAYSSYVQGLSFANSDVYKWLNAEFISAAFSDDERAKIVTTTISADPNPYYDTDQGGATQDKIFLLSIEEAETYLQPIFRVCESTEYAQSPNGNCAWWLRTMGYTSKDAAYVSAAGVIFPEGNPTEAMFGVRPAMWVELNP